MNERLVEDWLTKASERAYQTAFAQSLLLERMEVLRLGHSAHEHGKDIIAVDQTGSVHAYQLKDEDLDLKGLEKALPQITALVETQVEHPGLSGCPKHHPWLVTSGNLTIPVEDRIRVHNITWKKRGFRPLQTITGKQLIARFVKMAGNFWPQMPEDSRRLFNLYLANGKGSLDRDNFSQMLNTATLGPSTAAKAQTFRQLAAGNLFTSYALSSFYRAGNHWEVIQGWIISAARTAEIAERRGLQCNAWLPTFNLALNEALTSAYSLASEALKPDALRPQGNEWDEQTRARCTMCAGIIAATILIKRKGGEVWDRETEGRRTLMDVLRQGRVFIWGESAIPFVLAIVWALDVLTPEQLSDGLLLSTIGVIARTNTTSGSLKLPHVYDSADEAMAKVLRGLLDGEGGLRQQAPVSLALEPLVHLAALRLWRNQLAGMWSPLSKVRLLRLVPDEPVDTLLWRWERTCGQNQTRNFNAPQSWPELLAEARRDELRSIPNILRERFEFALLFLLCFPHRISTGLIKHLDGLVSRL